MNRKELIDLIFRKKTFLCVGLDTDLKKIPPHLLSEEDPVFAFNKAIIDATLPFAAAYKPNMAFYESMGIKGLRALEKTMKYLQQFSDEVFTIADAKRGDIGNTSGQYAQTFLDPKGEFNFDAITVAPYMGEDSVQPFLEYGKWVILLALTSNKGAFDFQFMEDRNGTPLYQKVLAKSQEWADENEMMYVCGATKAAMFQDIRRIVPKHFLLVPGVGAQGGDLNAVCKHGINETCGLLVNSSRGIIYADSSEFFAERAAEEARKIQSDMKNWL